jgi:hypothetical protein
MLLKRIPGKPEFQEFYRFLHSVPIWIYYGKGNHINGIDRIWESFNRNLAYSEGFTKNM